MVYSGARGIRNNNPLNLEDDGEAWEGLDTPRNDGTFLRFISPEYGFRAAARSIQNAIAHDGVPATIDGIVRHWSATDQDAYVQHVSNDLGVDSGATLDLTSVLPQLLASMTSQENGFNPYSIATIVAGINLA